LSLAPKCQIEVWHGANKIYTFNTNVAHIHTKQSLTNAVGNFNFLLPTEFGGKYRYYDIAGFDKAKIWLGYEGDSFSGDPLFVGRISQISTPLNMQGYFRQFNGKDQGEVLLRKLKGKTSWTLVAPHTIATTVATDCGLGTSLIDTDTGAMPISIEIDPDRYESYFNLLRTISDHWYDGSNIVKKDWYVDVNNNLVWASRDGTSPFRSGASVETLTVGQNIESYTVLRDLESVRNKIYVYGALERASLGKDTFTEALDVDATPPNDWVTGTGTGTTTADPTTKALGSYSIRQNTTVADYHGSVILNIPAAMRPNLNYYPSINFLIYREASLGSFGQLLITDNGAKTALKNFNIPNSVNWIIINIPAGKKNVDSWENVTSGFNWEVITTLQFYVWFSGTGTGSFYIDKLFFDSRNFVGTAEDATSYGLYGVREEAIVDEELRDDTECSRRAETLKYQLKDPPIRVDLVTKGNTNIKLGDRLSLTIPAENIPATNFDVVIVEHDFASQPQGFKTSATLLNTADVRSLPPRTKDELLVQKLDVIQASAENKQFWNHAIRRG